MSAIAAIGLCLLIAFLFSGIEAGLLSLNRIRLRHRVKMRERAAIRLERLLRNPERLLLCVVIVTNLMNIVALGLATHLAVARFGPWGYLLVGVVFLPILLFGVELLPKSLFRRFPYRTLARLAQPVRWTLLLLNPALKIAIRLAHRMVPADDPRSGKLFAAREDFKYFTIESERTGALSAEERRMIGHVVDFRTVRAADVMVPLESVPAIAHDRPVEELIAMSRGGSVDPVLVLSPEGEPLGLVNLLEALLDRGPRSRVSSFVRPLTVVDIQTPAPQLLRRLRSSRTPVLLVREKGRPLGLIFREALYQRMIAPPAEA